MADITRKNYPDEQRSMPFDTTPSEDTDAREVDFTPEEMAGLVRVREDIARGRYSDLTNEHKKLLFVKWLYEHERIGS